MKTNDQTKSGMMTTVTTVSAAEATIQRNIQIMRITLALTVLSFVTFAISLTSSYWINITYPTDFFMKRHNLYVKKATFGVIWECVHGRPSLMAINENQCDYHQSHLLNASIPAERALLGMIRTMLSFSAIHILLLIVTFICGLYSIREYRYTYKRLTGMIYIVTAGSLVVCIEALSNIFRHVSHHLPDFYPAGTQHSSGVCYILAWIIFVQLIGSSLAFFFCSRKRKGTFDEATEEEALANQPVNLGRF